MPRKPAKPSWIGLRSNRVSRTNTPLLGQAGISVQKHRVYLPVLQWWQTLENVAQATFSANYRRCYILPVASLASLFLLALVCPLVNTAIAQKRPASILQDKKEVQHLDFSTRILPILTKA